MKRSGRQSVIVWCLVLIFVASIIAVPIFGGISLKNQSDEGVDIFAFNPVCKTVVEEVKKTVTKEEKHEAFADID